jgi:predicted nucleic acid-binding protein
MIAPVFVDTNVFVYASDNRETIKQSPAEQWLERLWREQSGRTSVQVLNECYWTLTHKVRPALPANDAWDIVQSLFQWNPQTIDIDVLTRSREIERRYRLAWWDSLIIGSAQAQNCPLLLSEDLQDGAVYSGVTVRNPFKTGVSEATTEYALTLAATRQHRSRGRPKRRAMMHAAAPGGFE